VCFCNIIIISSSSSSSSIFIIIFINSIFMSIKIVFSMSITGFKA
jgi:hypothetical protein